MPPPAKNLSEIYNVLSSDEYLVAGKKPLFEGDSGDEEFVVVYDRNDQTEHGMHSMKRVYKILPGGLLEEVPIGEMINEVKAALIDKIDVGTLLEQVLRTGGPGAVIHAHSIIKKHPEVVKDITTRKGCLYLEIPNPDVNGTGADIYLRF